MPVEVKYRDGRSQEQRIAERLRCSSPAHGKRPQDHVAPDGSTTTHPNRTITTIYHASSASLHGRPKHDGD
jgi:hypothetical protein